MKRSAEQGVGQVLVTEARGCVTLQDEGRHGFQRIGVSVGGAMDPHAAELANRLAGNPADAVLIELERSSRLALRCEGLSRLALAGACVPVRLDGRPVPFWARIETNPSQPFAIGIEANRESGRWSYLALSGGCRLVPVLGGFGTDLRAGWGGVEGRVLRLGDRITLGRVPKQSMEHSGRSGWHIRSQVSPDLRPSSGIQARVLRILPGSHWNAFPPEVRQRFLNAHYLVTPDSDRMGYRLSGPLLHPDPLLEIDSEPVTFGSIQIPPDGSPIVLMADHPTQGGYPRLAEIISTDLGILAQCRAGTKVEFRHVDEQVALMALREWRQGMARLWVGLGSGNEARFRGKA